MNSSLRGPAAAGAVASLIVLITSMSPIRAQDSCPTLFRAEPGETLEEIASRCHRPLGDLFRANPALREARMPLDGLSVHIPENDDPSPLNWSAIGPAGTDSSANGHKDADFWTRDRGGRYEKAAGESTYLVREGDTLKTIAADLQLSLSEMLAANPDISDPDAVYAGELINVPGGATLVDTDSGRRFYHRYSIAPRITAIPTEDNTLRVIAVGLPPDTEVSLSAVRQSDNNAFATVRTSGSGSVKLDVPLPVQFAHQGNHIVVASVNGEVRATSKPIGTVASLGWPNPPEGGIRPASYSEDEDYDEERVGEPVTINGVVTPEGDHCPAVRDASGRLYTLATTNAVLHPGDVVTIDARVAPSDWCGKGIALAVNTLRLHENWTAAQAESPVSPPAIAEPPIATPPLSDQPRYRRQSDVTPNGSFGPAPSPAFGSAQGFTDVPANPEKIIRGVLTDEAPDCTTVRSDDGTLYSIPARLTSVMLGQRIEVKGHLAQRPACSIGVTFRAEDARKL